MPSEDDVAREPLLKKMFFGEASHTEREEKVLRYVIHRMNQDVRLHEVIREDYVRRNCSESEIDRIVNDPELVHACREYLWGTFRSGELSPRRGHHATRPDIEGSPPDDGGPPTPPAA